MWNTLKKHACHPLSLPCVYSSICNVVFTAKYKKQYLHVHWQKIAQQARKIAQTCLRSLHVFPTWSLPSWSPSSWLSSTSIQQSLNFRHLQTLSAAMGRSELPKSPESWKGRGSFMILLKLEDQLEWDWAALLGGNQDQSIDHWEKRTCQSQEWCREYGDPSLGLFSVHLLLVKHVSIA